MFVQGFCPMPARNGRHAKTDRLKPRQHRRGEMRSVPRASAVPIGMIECMPARMALVPGLRSSIVLPILRIGVLLTLIVRVLIISGLIRDSRIVRAWIIRCLRFAPAAVPMARIGRGTIRNAKEQARNTGKAGQLKSSLHSNLFPFDR